MQRLHWTLIFIFWVQFVILKKRVYFRRLMLLRVHSNRFLRNHMGKVVPRVFPSCWKLSHFRPNPTLCVSRRGLKTIWGNFQTAASDSYSYKYYSLMISLFWKYYSKLSKTFNIWITWSWREKLKLNKKKFLSNPCCVIVCDIVSQTNGNEYNSH